MFIIENDWCCYGSVFNDNVLGLAFDTREGVA